MFSFLRVAALLVFVLQPLSLMAAQEAFPPTQPGVSEVKVLPAGVLLKSTGSGNYFSESNRLFGPLFRYISTRDIAMTTPVEAKIDQAAMYFWVAPSEEAKVTGNTGAVEVVRIPERRVASRGARGGYSQENFVRTRDELLAWIATQPGLEIAGEPYAVYWHGPITPWFAKRSEVHVPVSLKAKS
jgi:SOUL heme-binding protein